jgi:hypothetical protein
MISGDRGCCFSVTRGFMFLLLGSLKAYTFHGVGCWTARAQRLSAWCRILKHGIKSMACRSLGRAGLVFWCNLTSIFVAVLG